MILKKGKINVRKTDGSVESVDILTGGIESELGTAGIPSNGNWTTTVSETTVTTIEDPYKAQRPSGTNVRYWITLASGGSFYCDALYKVTYNGTEYKNLVAKYCFFDDNGTAGQHNEATDIYTSGSYYSVGNRKLYDSRYQDTGEPFCLVYVPYGGAQIDGEYYYTHIANSCLLFTSSATTATVKVERCAANIDPINPALLGNYGRCDIPFEKMQGSTYPRVSIGCANIVGRGSYAIGEGNLSTGQFAIALGNNAYAIGEISFAHGLESKSTQEHSIAFGYQTLSDRPNSIALGYGNKSINGTDNILVIGNGSKISRSNALELDVDGKLTTNKVESNAVVVASPDGSKWKLTVGNDGSISSTRCEYPLPSGYTRKNWVQSTGSCTLDTGYYLTDKVNFRGCAMKSENNNIMIAAFQTIDGIKTGLGIGFMGADSTIVFTRRRFEQAATARITHSGKTNFDLSFGTSLIYTKSIRAIDATKPIVHTESFKLYNSTPAGMRIYDFRIYEDHECLHKYIPCTDSDGVVCLFDSITGETKYATGTALICG